MEKKEFIMNIAKEIVIAHIKPGDGRPDISSNSLKKVVADVKEAYDSIETKEC